jgi:hypothetical protein
VTLSHDPESLHPHSNFKLGNSCFPHVINLAVQSILKAIPTVAQRYSEYANDQEIALTASSHEYQAALELGTGPVDAC